jgi:hemerythrin-like domain-containing protein
MARREIPAAPPGPHSLKRDPALVALSRDHHGALMQALELRRAAERSSAAAAEVARSFLAFVASELSGHFADEEDVLLPLADRVAPEESARVRAEHREIEALTARIPGGLAGREELVPVLVELGDLIHDHVRYEERALFESLQRALGGDELAALGEALDAHRRARGWAESCPLPPRR